jgi:general secretion pathway protein L
LTRLIEAANVLEAASRTAEAARRALVWWRDELWHLVPLRVREALKADPIAVEIHLPHPGHAPQTVAVQALRSGRPAQNLQMEDWRGALAWAAEQRRRWGPLMRIDLILPAGACLIRQGEIPTAASNRIGQVLALELERATPFSIPDVRQGWRRLTQSTDAASLLVEHVVAKRHLTDSVLADARNLAVPIAAVDVFDPAAGSRLGVNLLRPAEVPRSLTGRLNQAMTIAVVLLAIATATASLIAVQRQAEALVRLEADISVARKEALEARKRLQDADSAFELIGRLRLRRSQDVRVIAVWEEVTRRLPNRAWLTDMRIENDVLWLDGYAHSASQLVGIMAQSSMFSGVALSAPVTRDAAKEGERFQLRMKIDKLELGQALDGRKSGG